MRRQGVVPLFILLLPLLCPVWCSPYALTKAGPNTSLPGESWRFLCSWYTGGTCQGSLESSWHIGHFEKYHIILFVCLPKLCISIVSSFSWDLQWSEEKTKAMLIKNFGGTNKEYYGIFWSGLFIQQQPPPAVEASVYAGADAIGISSGKRVLQLKTGRGDAHHWRSALASVLRAYWRIFWGALLRMFTIVN